MERADKLMIPEEGIRAHHALDVAAKLHAGGDFPDVAGKATLADGQAFVTEVERFLRGGLGRDGRE